MSSATAYRSPCVYSQPHEWPPGSSSCSPRDATEGWFSVDILSADRCKQYSLQVYRSDLKHGRISVVTKEHILSTLDDESQAFEFITQSPVYRSFPEGRALTPQAADVLRTVLVDGSILRDLSNEGIKLCYEMGWLHAEPTDRQGQEVVCVFPTPLHAK